MHPNDRREIETVLRGLRKELDGLEEQVQRVRGGLMEPPMPAASMDQASEDDQSVAPACQEDARASTAWADLVLRSDAVVEQHGVALRGRLDDLLSEELRHDVERQWKLYPDREPWIWWEDYVAVGAAGLAGGVLDLVMTHSVSGWATTSEDAVLRHGERRFAERFGDEAENPMRRHPLDARIPSDLLAGASQDLHRVAGPTHDLCRIREALSLMLGDETDFQVTGQSVAQRTGGLLRLAGIKGEAATTFTTFDDRTDQALFALLWHWYADFFTKRSLPLPGMSHLVDQGGAIAEWTVAAYKQGLNLKNLTAGLARLSGVALTELILRMHVVLQRWRTGESDLFDWQSRVRYQEMFLVAHAVAAGVGAAGAAVTWNPAFLNGAAVLAATRHGIRLALTLRRQHDDAMKKFGLLMASTQTGLDELSIKMLGERVARSA